MPHRLTTNHPSGDYKSHIGHHRHGCNSITSVPTWNRGKSPPHQETGHHWQERRLYYPLYPYTPRSLAATPSDGKVLLLPHPLVFQGQGLVVTLVSLATVPSNWDST